MMVLPGGMERTEEEYRRLFEAGGFSLTRIVPTTDVGQRDRGRTGINLFYRP